MRSLFTKLLIGAGVAAVAVSATVAFATHSWNGYHWARTANPFTLKVGDNLSSIWKPFLATVASDWSASNILDLSVVPGLAKSNCSATTGRVEVCNRTYGNNGWLGIAQIWVSGSHITKGTVKFNDTYFNTPTYNTSAWRQFVACQEPGHTLGLAHQDETFTNTNLGSCMDYTNDPDGTIKSQLSNLHPNQHDYDELATIYGHVDGFTTVGANIQTKGHANVQGQDDSEEGDLDQPSHWGSVEKRDSKGRPSLFEQGFADGHRVLTFVTWAN